MPTGQSGPNARLNCLNYNDLNGQPLEKAVIVNIFGGSRNMICFISCLYYYTVGKDGVEKTGWNSLIIFTGVLLFWMAVVEMLKEKRLQIELLVAVLG